MEGIFFIQSRHPQNQAQGGKWEMTGAGGGTLQSNEITIKIKNNGTWKKRIEIKEIIKKKLKEVSFLSYILFVYHSEFHVIQL